MSSREMDEIFLSRLLRVQGRRRDLLPDNIDVRQEFSIYRSIRRGSNTQARNQGVSGTDIDVAHRRRDFENVQGLSLTIKGHLDTV